MRLPKMGDLRRHPGSVMPQIPVSVGELVDKLTILALKQRHLQGEALAHVHREHALLQEVFAPLAAAVPADLQQQLAEVNAQLWQVEDAIRDCDQRADFGPTFVALAQRVYRLNDRRSAIKYAINQVSGSSLVEQKRYSGGA